MWKYSFVNIRTLYDHLIINGIDQSYQKWIHHSENHGLEDDSNVVEGNSEDMNVDAPHIAQMVDDLQDEPFDNPEELCSLLSDAETPLSPGCVKRRKKRRANLMKVKIESRLAHLSVCQISLMRYGNNK